MIKNWPTVNPVQSRSYHIKNWSIPSLSKLWSTVKSLKKSDTSPSLSKLWSTVNSLKNLFDCHPCQNSSRNHVQKLTYPIDNWSISHFVKTLVNRQISQKSGTSPSLSACLVK
ncbi:hypothetical protein PoB_003824700 [Plakobranchus ocellatus]|uniref:Thiol oxidase n=1 Tax=Plakobranchus ocellatus TaxID=259542 RepID=A0AAV4AXF5_9GAST|nr:hypothetical protein PoB_003824700 [Plakobranchus ocellatus]